MVATGGPGGFFLSIFSTGISLFWQFGLMLVANEPLTNQILCPWTASHDIWPVNTTLSKMTSQRLLFWPGDVKKLMLEVSGLEAG
jgi:hypothetical protein